MSTQPKTGPMTPEELQELWQSAVDDLYARPFLEQEDSGFEVHQQVFEQLARASRAIDATTQAMFILPWSGQSDQPAQGEAKATVQLTLSRTSYLELPMVITRDVLFEEQTTDWGAEEGIVVRTGRRYRLVDPLVFGPGEAGPFTVAAEAEGPGWGYNNPFPGTIAYVVQPGATLQNAGATVTDGKMTAANVADTPVPEHVGQYLHFTAGSNVGRVAHVVGYQRPHPELNDGGTLNLERMAVVQGGPTFAGPFIVGEQVIIYQSAVEVGHGTFLKETGSGAFSFYTFVLNDGIATVVFDTQIYGVTSAASASLTAQVLNPVLTTEPAAIGDAGASWQVLRWSEDVGLTVTNAEQPTGGRLGYLDALGAERGIRRSTAEGDEPYRQRVSQVADVVTPNALRRAVNRLLAPYGLTGCLREVGGKLLPGFFFDHDAYDYDFTARPQDRYKVLLDYLSFRAFFLVGVPPLNWGEFGFAYDGGTHNAYDCGPALAFYDGYALGAANMYRNIWNALNSTKAGGVGFDLYVERLGCF